MKIIVLGNSKYKESDYIFNAISEEGSFSFKVCGGQTSKSPYQWLNNPLTIADIELGDKRYKHPTLKEAKLISSPMTGEDSLAYLYSLSLINEVANKVFPEQERYLLFKDIEQSLTALKEKKDYAMVILILLAHAATLAGAELEVNQCVFCGTKERIVAFSFADGGFVCRDCLEESGAVTDLTSNQMYLIRYIFKSPNYQCVGSERFSSDDKNEVLKHLREYFKDYLGIYLETIGALLK